ncbi:UNVERIFIED_CONTAM: Heparan-alpha-glucosaminide N-acetyltransferase [Sesamum angustifolium]|uniref:Heparan-alpha-glucosaminide N-acetyltransferase n=1 Tax=Sesamum angustifolium TaxID=2727405 RepID=A0AAW2Q7V1_9LAMI
MASYQLIKESDEDGALDLERKDCTLHVEGYNVDVESAFQKINPSSPPLRSGSDTGANAASRGTSTPARLVSLDVFRGLTVVNMSSGAAASKKAILRALKLLILGVFLQGGYFHGINNLTYGVDIDLIRWMGILQRIAVAYLVAAMCEIWLRNDEKVSSGLSLLKKYQWHRNLMFMLSTIYLLLLYGLYVPDWEYQIPIGAPSEAKIFMVKCGVHGDTGPACNAAGMIDRMILGVQHLYRRPIYARTKQCSINSPDYGPLPPNAPSWCQAPFDPEGILSTVMAIVTCLIGLQFGHIIVHFKDHRNRLLLWLAPSSAFIVLGLLCDVFGMHITRHCTLSVIHALPVVLQGFYLLQFIWWWMYGCRRYTLVLEWMGMNALLIYILVACNILPLILQGFYWRDPRNNILSLVGIGNKLNDRLFTWGIWSMSLGWIAWIWFLNSYMKGSVDCTSARL